MKTLCLYGLILFCACGRAPRAESLLQNDKMRHAIMQAICNDSVLSTEMVKYLTDKSISGKGYFMRSLMANSFKKGDTSTRNLMTSNMLLFVNNDSDLCDRTCTQISQAQYPQIKMMMYKKMNSLGPFKKFTNNKNSN